MIWLGKFGELLSTPEKSNSHQYLVVLDSVSEPRLRWGQVWEWARAPGEKTISLDRDALECFPCIPTAKFNG